MRSPPILGTGSRAWADGHASGFFATGLLYGQVKKIYRRRQLVRVTYVIRCGTRTTLKTALQTLGLSGRITTAFVERLNLTVRQSVAALIRRTWSTMQAAPQLLTHLEW
jgi:hypothetical protein